MNGLAARTRDGMPSVAAMMETDGDDFVEVDAAEMAAWAKEAKIALNRGWPIIDQVNAARASLGLRRMKLRAKPPAALAAAPARFTPAADAPTAGAPPSSTATPCQRQHTYAPAMPTTEFGLVDLVTTHSGTITGLVTPWLAEQLLALNTANRPMSPRAIDRFIKILHRGAWQLTGEAIIVSREGVLSDGQHRLTAIKRSGIAALCDIRFGIAREAFAVTGTGARRTTGNALAIAGKPHAAMQAAIGRLIVQHDTGCTHCMNIQVDSDLVIAATDKEPAIGGVAALIRPLKFKPVRAAPFGFALVLAQRATSLDQAASFAHLVDSGKAEETDATRRLHVRLRDAAFNKERLAQIDVAVLTVRAWNAWIVGKPVQRLQVTDADRAAGGFPEVTDGGRSKSSVQNRLAAPAERVEADG